MTATFEIASATRDRIILRKLGEPFIHIEYRKAYSKANAFNLGILAKAAYLDKGPLEEFLFDKNRPADRTFDFTGSKNVFSGLHCETPWDLKGIKKTCFQIMEDAGTDTQGFQFWTPGYHLISCRGTASIADVLTDANAEQVPFQGGVGLAHKGFHTAFQSIRDFVDKAIPKSGNAPVICTGHSLGGAIATLVAAYVRHKYKREVLLYTYGCPLVGNSDFVKHFTSVEPITAWRCVHNQDLITTVPPPGTNLRLSMLPMALSNPIHLINATVDFSGKPYAHLGKVVFLRRLPDGAFCVDEDRKSPTYLRVDESFPVRQSRPLWQYFVQGIIAEWAANKIIHHFMAGYVSVLGSDLRLAILANLETASESLENGKKILAYLEAEISVLEKEKAKAEKEYLMPVASAPSDATAAGKSDPAKLTPAERLRLLEDALSGKSLERSVLKGRLAKLASPAYKSAVLKEILDRPMTPSLKKEFEYHKQHLKF